MAPPRKPRENLMDDMEQEEDQSMDQSMDPHDGPPHLMPALNDEQEVEEIDTSSSRKSTRIRTSILPPKLAIESAAGEVVPKTEEDKSIDNRSTSRPSRESIDKSKRSSSSRLSRKQSPKVMSAKRAPIKATPRRTRGTNDQPKMKAENSDESDENGVDDNQKRHYEFTHTVPNRLPNYKESCFMCEGGTCSSSNKVELDEDEMDEEDDETKTKRNWIVCKMDHCGQRMHTSCLKKFVCSEYKPMDAGLLFCLDGPVCPAHFCWHCYEERKKNASRFGELVDCLNCIRSFHRECVPAGAKTKESNEKGKRPTTVCFIHAQPKGITNRLSQRLKYCTECEQLILHDDGSMVKGGQTCDRCTNVFHVNCSFRKVAGSLGKGYNRNWCSYCVVSPPIVHNQKVMAYYPNKYHQLSPGNYPGIALALSAVPEKIRPLLGANYGKLGFIPVKWIWEGTQQNPYYNMVHFSKVQRVADDTVRNLPDELFVDELRSLFENIDAPTRPFDHEMRKTIKKLKENKIHPGTTRKTIKLEIDMCGCLPEAGSKIKCAKDCQNRHGHIECTRDCDDKVNGIICANRSMQRSEERNAVKYEVKLAGRKGFGAFAIQPIKENEFIFEYAGEVIGQEEQQRREARAKALRARDECTYMMGLRMGQFVDSRFEGNDSRYVNHSCEPNAVVTCVQVPYSYCNKGFAEYEYRVQVTALKDIEVGQEICFDYQLQKSDGLAIDYCYCGTDSCRQNLGTKKNDDDSDDEFYDKNEPLTAAEDDRKARVRGSEEKENKKKAGVKKEVKKEEETGEKKETKKRRTSTAPGTPKRTK